MSELDARIEALTAELNRLMSERVELRWPGLRDAFVSGLQALEDVANAYGLSTAKIYRLGRQCGWGRRKRRQSKLSRILVGQKLNTRAANLAERRRGA